MKSYQRTLKEKTNGVKNARPVHVSETWEQIVYQVPHETFFQIKKLRYSDDLF